MSYDDDLILLSVLDIRFWKNSVLFMWFESLVIQTLLVVMFEFLWPFLLFIFLLLLNKFIITGRTHFSYIYV